MRVASFLTGAAAFALVSAALPARAADTRLIEVNPQRTIEVAGEGSVEVAPDVAQITLGVTTTAKDAGEAMAANAKAVTALIAAVKEEGVAPADIQTSSLSVSPSFGNRAQGSNAAPAITGYTVSNMVTVTARDLGRLGAVIDKAAGAGANAMYGIAFGQTNPSALLDKARPIAVADAKRKADIYAAAAGAKVGRLMALTDQAGGMAPVPQRMFATSAMPAPPTPIEAGRDKLTVTVTARYELTE